MYEMNIVRFANHFYNFYNCVCWSN